MYVGRYGSSSWAVSRAPRLMTLVRQRTQLKQRVHATLAKYGLCAGERPFWRQGQGAPVGEAIRAPTSDPLCHRDGAFPDRDVPPRKGDDADAQAQGSPGAHRQGMPLLQDADPAFRHPLSLSHRRASRRDVGFPIHVSWCMLTLINCKYRWR